MIKATQIQHSVGHLTKYWVILPTTHPSSFQRLIEVRYKVGWIFLTGTTKTCQMKNFTDDRGSMSTRNLNGSQFTLPKPKEHGAWGMLYVPFVMGVSIAGSLPHETLWLLMATTCAFLSQKPFAQLLSKKESPPHAQKMRHTLAWFCVYAGTSAVIFAFLYFQYQLKGLRIFGLLGIPIVLAFSYFVRHKEVRTVSVRRSGSLG